MAGGGGVCVCVCVCVCDDVCKFVCGSVRVRFHALEGAMR